MLDNIGDKMVIIYFYLILVVMMHMYKVCILFIVGVLKCHILGYEGPQGYEELE